METDIDAATSEPFTKLFSMIHQLAVIDVE